MATYAAYFNGKSAELQANSLYAAKLEAIALFKPRKSQQHMVSIVLTAKGDGTPVSLFHSNAELG